MLPSYLVAQLQPSQCMVEVKDAISKLNTLPDFDQGIGVRMEYASNNKIQTQEKIEVFNEEVKYIFKKRKVFVQSKGNLIFQDEHHMVSVLPEQQLIYLSNRQVDGYYENLFKNAAVIQDSVLNNATVVLCESMDNDYKKIALEPAEAYREVMGISRLWFIIDTDKNIKEMTLRYNKGRVREVELELRHVDMKYTGNAFVGTALSQVMASGKLINKYQNYKVLDLRKQ
jgi:hypothetical protein